MRTHRHRATTPHAGVQSSTERVPLSRLHVHQLLVRAHQRASRFKSGHTRALKHIVCMHACGYFFVMSAIQHHHARTNHTSINQAGLPCRLLTAVEAITAHAISIVVTPISAVMAIAMTAMPRVELPPITPSIMCMHMGVPEPLSTISIHTTHPQLVHPSLFLLSFSPPHIPRPLYKLWIKSSIRALLHSVASACHMTAAPM